MRRWLAIILLAVPTVADAQAMIDLNHATFSWSWASASDGIVDAVAEFRIKCGPTVGSYPNVTVIPNPAARSYPVKDAIGGSGVYHCILTAANVVGESSPTPEVFFVAGVSPSSPSNFRLTP